MTPTKTPGLTAGDVVKVATFAKGLADRDSFPRQVLRLFGLVFAAPLVLAYKFPFLLTAALVAWVVNTFLTGWALAVAAASPFAVGAVWRRVHPRSFAPLGAWLLGCVRCGLVYRWRWRRNLKACGLTKPGPDGEHVPPHLLRVITTPAADAVRVRMLPGQAPVDFINRADDLAHAFGSRQVRVRSTRPGRVTLYFARKDQLAATVPAMPFTDPAAINFEALPVARTEDAETYRLELMYFHVLTAGATGAGKGSVLWSTVRALAPAVPTGVVQLWGCDPKGGIELALGRSMFTRFAADDEPGDMVALVHDAAELVTARSARLRGHTRKHSPTTVEPFVVLIIDELAFLSDYQDDNKQRSAFNKALKVVLSQGRAAGVSVMGFVQDPRKSVVEARNLFPTKIALRLDTGSEVEMMLGKDAWQRGARCEDIPAKQPGTGYVLIDGDPDPVRVRFGWVSDDDIRAMARTYPVPPPRPALEAATAGDVGVDITVTRTDTNGGDVPALVETTGDTADETKSREVAA